MGKDAHTLFGDSAVSMKLLYLLPLVGLLTLGACSSPPKTATAPTNLKPEAARKRAQRDFAAGRPKVYSAGGYAIFEPGITERQRALVADLPRDGSLAGCTNPKVRYSISFATAYNQEIVSLLKGRHAH
jgi:hypothetical protein